MPVRAAGPAHVGGSTAVAPAPGLQDALFPAVGGEGRVEAVVRRLGEAIGLGLLEVGARLPPETELAARFDVAPVTLREALSILRQAGMLETRRGRGGGTFVRGYADVPAADQLKARIQEVSPDDLRDLGELRKAIAGAASALAAERAAPGEIAHLRVLLDRMSRAKAMNEFRRGDGRFHVEIAAASRSSRLTQTELAIQSELTDLISLLPSQRRIMNLMNRQHAALVDALDARDGALARRLAEQHVDSANDLLIGLVLTPVDE
jgi:GntR family transcriptional regulator, transcriptional repressor for pyruvate dehydrogenase complex